MHTTFDKGGLPLQGREMPLIMSRDDLEFAFAMGSLRCAPLHMASFWSSTLEGLDALSSEGVTTLGALSWRYTSSPVRYDLDSGTVCLITDRQWRRDVRRKVTNVGVIEWGQIESPLGRVAIASLPALRQPQMPQIMLYTNHPDAPLRLHGEIVSIGIPSRARYRRQTTVM